MEVDFKEKEGKTDLFSPVKREKPPETDENGFQFYAIQPAGTRVATLDDFHVQGKRKMGMKFLIFGQYWKVYQVYVVTGGLTAAKLEKFVKEGRVFVWGEN
jgi:hypothetical protein